MNIWDQSDVFAARLQQVEVCFCLHGDGSCAGSDKLGAHREETLLFTRQGVVTGTHIDNFPPDPVQDQMERITEPPCRLVHPVILFRAPDLRYSSKQTTNNVSPSRSDTRQASVLTVFDS